MPRTSRKTRHLSKTTLAFGCGSALLIAWLTLPIEAFAPSNFKAALVGGTSHQRMTEQAIRELDNEFFGITDLTKPMKKAIEEIAEANIQVDEDQFLSSKHFDGENFAGGQSFILAGNRGLIIQALERENASSARFHLGSALHSIQDFYSHTNWIELGNGSPHPQVGVEGATIGGIAPLGFVTCVDCQDILIPPVCPDCTSNVVTGFLTSGYYGGEDRSKPSSDKCSHGGILDGSATGRFGHGINKDVLDCAFSPHHHLHGAAVGVAREATKKFIRELRDDITESQLKLLLGVGPNLAMAIDVTGSMGSVISQVKSVATGLVDRRLGTDEEPSKYVLVPFSDPGVGPTTVTTDPNVFKTRINGLRASGGGDCPELAMTGMLRALSASDKGGVLFMFTDASAKDRSLTRSVVNLSLDKEIKVYVMTFGSCSPIDPGFIQLASESGGQLFELLRSEAGKVTQLADFLVRSNAVDVLSVADDFVTGTAVHTVPVDSTMTRVTFSTSGTAAVTLRRPDGSAVAATDPGVSFVSLVRGAIYSIETPEIGEWTVELSGSGGYSLTVSGESNLDLETFRFVELGGRPGHEGLFPIDGLPVEGQTSTATAVLSGDFLGVDFMFRAKDGGLIQSFFMDPNPVGESHELIGEVGLPEDAFLVYVVGVDTNGIPFQRVLPAAVKPQPVRITAPLPQVLPVGQTTTYTFEVTHFGTEDTFRFSGSDDQRFLTSISPTTFTLGMGESQLVTVELTVPVSTLEGTPDTLTVNVESLTGDANNFAVINSTVADADITPPVILALTADPSLLWPPNHKLRTVVLSVEVTDDRDPSPICQITGVTSNEPIDGPGDGSTDFDWLVADPLALELELRAERSGTGSGRTYTIGVECSDLAGNSATASVEVVVPHNR